MYLLWLSAERATLSEAAATTSWLAQNSGAASTHNYSLGMAEYCGNLEAARALLFWVGSC